MEFDHNIVPVQRSDSIGLVERAIQELMRFVRQNNLTTGDRLPSQALLAQQLNISRAALREALASMEAAGYIKQIHGVGTFISSNPHEIRTLIETNLSLTEMIRASGMEPGTQDVEITYEVPPDYLSEPLGLPKDHKLRCLRRVRTADGTPIAYSVHFLTDAVGQVDLLAMPPEMSIYQYLNTNYNIHLEKTDALIEVTTAHELTSRKLGVPPRAPLLKLTQIHYDDQDRSVMASVELFIQNEIKLKLTRHRPRI
jgi:GntR family transcriptional regulator